MMEILEDIVSGEDCLRDALEQNKEYASFRNEEKKYRRLHSCFLWTGATSISAFFVLNPYEITNFDLFLCTAAAVGVVGNFVYGTRYLHAKDNACDLQLGYINRFYSEKKKGEK